MSADRKIIKWSEARDAGLKTYYTGRPCPQGHVSERFVAGGCVECRNHRHKRIAKLTPELLRREVDYDPETGLFRWRVARPRVRAGKPIGSKAAGGYLRFSVLGRSYLAHTLAWLYVYGEFPPAKHDIDHVNGDRTDNRIVNLRIATRSQNLANGAKRRAGLKGVYFHKAKQKWHARLQKDGHVHSLGYYATEQEAHEAYRLWAVRAHGQFARFE